MVALSVERSSPVSGGATNSTGCAVPARKKTPSIFLLPLFRRIDEHTVAMKIRPLEEANIADVIPNGGLIQTVKQAARQTTPDQPMVIVPHEVDRELIGNALIKRWNGHFRDAVIAQFLGAPVSERKAVMALTYERAVRSGMLRCMIILQEDCAVGDEFSAIKYQ